MKSKINIARIIWITSIFAILITILIMVMDYKINYQYLNQEANNKLYFYNCDNEVCTSQSNKLKKELYSEYNCYTACPKYKGTINEKYALLKNKEGYILYNYKEGIKIAENYDEYKFINDNYIIVTKNKLKGVIDTNNNKTIEIKYTDIGYYKNKYLTGYNTNSIIVKSDNVYGIINYKDGTVIEEIKYKESEINKLLDIINEE